VEVLETNVQYSVESRDSTLYSQEAYCLTESKIAGFFLLTESRPSPPRWCACFVQLSGAARRQSDTLSDLVEIILPRPGLAVSIRRLT